LTSEELERLGSAIREAETIPWDVDEAKPKAKHLAGTQEPLYQDRSLCGGGAPATAVHRLSAGGKSWTSNGRMWTWSAACRFLPTPRQGRKTVIVNAPALAVLTGLDRIGSYVVPGDDPEKPRADLKRPWEAVARRAGRSIRGRTCTG
jgi:hypothetical protein